MAASSAAVSPNGTGLHYSRIAELGQGGMAEVYLAIARGPGGFNKLVVLKTIRRQLVVDDELRQMFLEEARLSARLNHSNIVHVYEVIDHSITPAIVMEYLDGQSLSAVLATLRPQLTLGMQIRIIQDVLIGLHYSHELRDFDGTPLNIVHRDVSPQNVFVTYDGMVKVLDFGIAKVASRPSQTRTGVIKGKLAYMPPEQLLGEPTDRRADVYAVGCILWDFLAGERLWRDWTEGAIMRAIIDGRMPRPSEVKQDVDPELENVAMRALAPNPEHRYPTALAFLEELERYVTEHELSSNRRELGALLVAAFDRERQERSASIRKAISSRDATPTPSDSTVTSAAVTTTNAHRPPRSGSRLAALASAAIVIAGASAAWLWAQPRSEAPPAAPAAPAPAQSVELTVQATPADATFSIDGVPIDGNPATLRRADDGADHVLQASAEGFVPQARMVRFDRELRLAFALQREPPPAASASATPEPVVRSRVMAARTVPARTVKLPRTAPPPTVASVPAPRTADCSPPFRIQNGVKVYKPECL